MTGADGSAIGQTTTPGTNLLRNAPMISFLVLPRTKTERPRQIIPVLHTSPSTTENSEEYSGGLGRLNQLVHQLQQHCVRDPNLFQHYQHASMMD